MTEFPRSAPVPVPMVYVPEAVRWEYRRTEYPSTGPAEAELNALGEQGWELAGLHAAPSGVVLYFKRIRPR